MQVCDREYYDLDVCRLVYETIGKSLHLTTAQNKGSRKTRGHILYYEIHFSTILKYNIIIQDVTPLCVFLCVFALCVFHDAQQPKGARLSAMSCIFIGEQVLGFGSAMLVPEEEPCFVCGQ